MTQTTTLVSGFRNEDGLYVGADTNTWADLTDTWADYSLWHTSPGNLQLQVDVDEGQSISVMPNIDIPYFGTLSAVVLKISDTGAFAGEEETITFASDTEYTYPAGRYYRWTFTVAPNEDNAVAIADTPVARNIAKTTQNYVSDVQVDAQSIDSDRDSLITTDIGLVTHVVGTAHQGGEYVAEDYVIRFQTPSEGTGRSAATVTTVNSPQTSTEIKKFGTSSWLHSDTQDDSVKIDIAPDFSNDVTLEFWFYIPSNADQIADLDGSAGSDFGSGSTSGDADAYNFTYTGLVPIASLDTAANGVTLTGTTTITREAWHHYAVERSGSTLRLYLDGAVEDTHTITTETFDAITDFGFGNFADDSLKFYMDELRISSVARYSGAFTPATDPHVASEDDLVLLHFDGTFADDEPEDFGFVEYIEEQRGGSVVIENKNPLSVRVVDYNGSAWDGTADLIVTGMPKIVLSNRGVVGIAVT